MFTFIIFHILLLLLYHSVCIIVLLLFCFYYCCYIIMFVLLLFLCCLFFFVLMFVVVDDVIKSILSLKHWVNSMSYTVILILTIVLCFIKSTTQPKLPYLLLYHENKFHQIYFILDQVTLSVPRSLHMLSSLGDSIHNPQWVYQLLAHGILFSLDCQ